MHKLALPRGGEGDLTQALATHWPHREYAGELDILWSAGTKVDLESAWSFWSKGKIHIHPIAGPHLELLESPYVQLMADSIEKALAQKMKVPGAAAAEKRD